MASRGIFVAICVALALNVAESRNSDETYVKKAVPCLKEWWASNKDVLLENPSSMQMKTVMEQMSVKSLSDPWMQLAVDTALTDLTKSPKTSRIGREGLRCIECLRQLVPRPARC